MATIYHLGGYGSGKSYDALRLGIYNELVNGKRGIVTNIALLQEPKQNGKTVSTKSGLGALNELLNRRFKNLDARVLQRVRILDESEVPHFFCHRISRGGYHYDIPVPDAAAEKRGARPDFSLLRDDGCVFVLDEFHDYFNARLWAEVGRSVGWYKNQQRKLGDDIHACTPQIDEVDKQLRTIGHEYRAYTNLGLRKIKGIVMPNTFICTVYSSLDALKRKAEPLNRYPFTLDVELANCYDTAKGVRGLQGGSADIGKRPKGLHWSIPVLITISIISFILYWAFHLKHHYTNEYKHAQNISGTSQQQKFDQAGNSNPHNDLSGNLPQLPFSQAISPALTNAAALGSGLLTNELICTGWCKVGSEYLAWLSDGTSYSSADNELDYIQKKKISILGHVYKILPGHAYTDAQFIPSAPFDLPPAVPRPVNDIQVIPFGVTAQRTLPAAHHFNSAPSFGSLKPQDTYQAENSGFPQ